MTVDESARYQTALDGDLRGDMLTRVLKDTEVLRWYTARQAQAAAVQLVGTAGAGAFVVSLCYSVDLEVLCDALIAAHQRSAFVTVVIDKRMTLYGKTKEQLSRCHRLNSSGIVVRLMEGSCSRADYAAVGRAGGWRGIQHAKGVLVGNRAIVGSTNWTTSSRSNSEVSLLLQASGDELETLKDVFWRVVLRSEPFLEAITNGQIQTVAEQSQILALRSRSLPRLAEGRQ